VRVWRITRSVHAAHPLSGEGAARAGNRWNSKGVRIGYTSTSRPLAVLEMLPGNWNALLWSESGRAAGDRWARESQSAALLVPSVVLPAERNLLINPLHPEFSKVKIQAPERHAVDRRLLR
jgi:RES domain-containing protein